MNLTGIGLWRNREDASEGQKNEKNCVKNLRQIVTFQKVFVTQKNFRDVIDLLPIVGCGKKSNYLI